ncbi:hypothetical protein EJ08DRAFT_734287 [Tothia fuscella]|uniref:Uncharacterized protein n=1 Tax=Tothia fuscella TaxID=1048955 RepID=A0A9P4TXE1_9PEZI|nr:hypothetical protein EJ08DRAFT_734287 [Tothia fuscella]
MHTMSRGLGHSRVRSEVISTSSRPIAFPRPLSFREEESSFEEPSDMPWINSLNSDGFCEVRNDGNPFGQHRPCGKASDHEMHLRNRLPEVEQYSIASRLQSGAFFNSITGKERKDSGTDVKPPSITPCGRCKYLSQKHHRLKSTRQKVLTTREHVHIERQVLKTSRNALLCALKDLVEVQSQLCSIKSNLESSSKVSSLYDRVVELEQELDLQESLVRKLETELGSLEHHMGKKEEEMFAIQSSLDLNRTTYCETDSISTRSSNPKSKAKSLCTMVHEYYDRAGDIAICRSRLDDLEDEFMEVKEKRDSARRQGQPIVPVEVDFVTAYLQERATMVENYIRARKETQILYQNCQDAGHQVEAVQLEGYGRDIDQLRRVQKGPGDEPEKMDSNSLPFQLLMVDQIDRDAHIMQWQHGVLRTRRTHSSDLEQLEDLVTGDAEVQSDSVQSSQIRETGRNKLSLDSATIHARQSSDGKKRVLEADWQAEQHMRQRYSDPILRKPNLVDARGGKSYLKAPQSSG